MRSRKAARRSFLKGTFAGAAAAGAAALPISASAAPGTLQAVKKIIALPAQNPSPLFSPATQLGNLLFLSGSGAMDPQTHKPVPGPIGNQVKQCLDNLKAVLEAAGSSVEKVLKCNVYLTDIADFQGMNQAYHSFFSSNPPARTTVAVKDLPGGSPVEIECIASV
jgi:2-iminobutanoate/2-iminopropanoate deaminase